MSMVNWLLLWSLLQIDFMLLWVCSVIHHRLCQSVVRTKEEAHLMQQSVSLMFLPYFGVFSGLLLYRPLVTWNVFVLYDKEANYC